MGNPGAGLHNSMANSGNWDLARPGLTRPIFRYTNA
jgi:hypothetical protein